MDLALVAQEDSIAETIRKVGLEKLLSIGEIIDKYYSDLEEAFNEEIANTLPEHRPHDCKIELVSSWGFGLKITRSTQRLNYNLKKVRK